MTRSFMSRAAAGFAAVAVGLLGVGSGVASAADDGVSSAVGDVSTITAETGSLHVTKLTPSSEAQRPGDGTKLASNPAGSKPIEGVKFTVLKVNGIDLKTNEGWKKAAAVRAGTLDNATNPKVAPSKVTVSGGDYNGEYTLSKQGDVQTTSATGQADFASLPLGLYVVWEQIPASGVMVDQKHVDAGQVSPAAPFFVTLPVTNPKNRSEWLYDVYAYPKNELTEKPSKTVNDDLAAVGSGNVEAKSTVTYTLTAKVPNVAELKAFTLVDKFKTSQLEWIQSGATDVVKVGDVTLTPGTDFNFQGPRTSGEYSYVAMNVSGHGLKDVLSKHKGETVSWTFKAKALKTTGATEIANTPYLSENPSGWSVSEPGTPGPEVKTYYGKVEVNKKGEDETPLPGAKFALYECSKDGYTDGSKSVKANWVLDEANRVTVGGKNEWVTADSTGKLVIDGLLVNDYRNNSVYVNGKSGAKWVEKSWYCLKEVQAPAGYELLPNPIKFQLTSTEGTTTPKDVVLSVHDNKTPGLPVTGGTGIMLLVGAGVLLVAGSSVYAYAANRKRNN